MVAASRGEGPVKAWIEPDRFAYARAFPLQMGLFVLSVVGSAALAYALHPLFWGVVVFVLIRQASLEASLRELFREGMLHPSLLIPGTGGLLATLVRLSSEQGPQDAVVISRAPRRWGKALPPWGGQRVAMVIAGEPPVLKPLSPDVAGIDERRARSSVDRIPEDQWRALTRALGQVVTMREGLHPVQLGPLPWFESEPSSEPVPDVFPEHMTSDEMSVWCAALPCVEEPAMAPREQERVVHLKRRALLLALARLAASVVMLGAFAALSLHVAASGAKPDALLSLFGLACLFAAPTFVFAAVRSFVLSRKLARDLARGKVLRFAGPLSNFESLALDPDLALLFRRGLLTADADMHEELVVLPVSGQLLHAGGRWATGSITLSIKRVADPPREPVKLSLPAEFAAERHDATAQLARRRLTAQELSELAAQARQLRRPSAGFWWVFGFVALALGAWHREGFQVPPTSVAVPLALLASCGAVWSSLRRFRLASRVDDDIELGWVLTVDPAPSAPSAELPAMGVETLLNAQLDWTVNKRPAAWRRSGGLH